MTDLLNLETLLKVTSGQLVFKFPGTTIHFSAKCSDSFLFYIDNFIEEFYVIITTLDALNPRATVFNPVGGEVASCRDFSTSATQTIHLICNGKNLHGTGAYKVQLSADSDK